MVVPSVLTKDPEDLERRIRILEPLVEVVQIDIMDGEFVPNTSVEVEDVQKVAPQTPMEIERIDDFTFHDAFYDISISQYFRRE